MRNERDGTHKLSEFDCVAWPDGSVHIPLHHAQRRVREVGVNMGDCIMGNCYIQMPDVGIQR
jgi:hypothetical protein